MSLVKLSDEDKKNALRELTKTFYGIEKPLMSKYKIEVKNLEDFVQKLHSIFSSDSVNIELVNHLMMVFTPEQQEWRPFAKFDRYHRYTRNLVDAGNDKFNLMILCWNEGQSSTIHDHADSHCFLKVLKGSLNEVKYKFPNETENSDDCIENEHSELEEISRSTVHTNDVCYINDNIGLHRIENPSHVETAVSLHLYCPPFDQCSVFDGKRSFKAKVTFWSKFGKRLIQDE